MTETEITELSDAVWNIGIDGTEAIATVTMAKLAKLDMVSFVGSRIELTDQGQRVFNRLESGDLEDEDVSDEFY